MNKTLCLACLFLASAASAGEKVYSFRTVEDASVQADPSVCASAPFRVNARLAASVWAYETRADTGQVDPDRGHRIGTANACLQITTLTFPTNLQQNFYARFDLPQGRYTVNGVCTIISNSVPQAGIILAGCSLKVVGHPPEVKGGMMTSASVFNPLRIKGFSTGSYWTLQVYTAEATPDDAEEHVTHDKDLESVDDARSDEDIAAAAGGQP